MIKTVPEGSITRRGLLRGGVACALASAVPTDLLGEAIFRDASQTSSSEHSPSPFQPELYAFRGTGQESIVIAVTWAEESTCNCMVRIHAGTKTWQFKVPAHGSFQSLHTSESSLFIGKVVAPARAYGGIMTAVVMEVDACPIGQHGPSEIWAERMVGGLRQRIGAPFLSNILKDHTKLASLYHSSSPETDRTLLLQPLSIEIARRLRTAGSVVNPDSHAFRLANALLPDVLHYDPRLPAGFTFAAQNGRHPSESSDEVVHTVLNGGKPSGPAGAGSQSFVKSFPYFEQWTTAI
jgi:hypothetical protein